MTMNRPIALLLLAAVVAVVFISGCTQTPAPPGPSGGTPSGGTPSGSVSKAVEDQAASALESELDQAVDNLTTSDIENTLLAQ